MKKLVLYAIFSLFVGFVCVGAPQYRNKSKSVKAMTLADSIALWKQQKITYADSLYTQLTALKSEGTTDNELYRTVLECHDSYMFIVDADTIAPERRFEHKMRLAEMFELLYDGGFYYYESGSYDKATELFERYFYLPNHDLYKDKAGNKENRFKYYKNYPGLMFFVSQVRMQQNNYPAVLKVLKQYLKVNGVNAYQTDNHENLAYLYLAKASQKLGNDADHRFYLLMGLANHKFPNDKDLLYEAVISAIRLGDKSQVESYLERFEAAGGAQADVLEFKGVLAEMKGEMFTSLNFFEQVARLKVNDNDAIKNWARANYNHVITEMQRGLTDERGNPAEHLYIYLEKTVALLEQVNLSEKLEGAYIDCVIDSYVMLGQGDRAKTFADTYGMPVVERNQKRFAVTNATIGSLPIEKLIETKDSIPSQINIDSNPSFFKFAGDYASERIMKWMEQGKYEKTIDYHKRISPSGVGKRNQLYAEISNAKDEYIESYGSNVSDKYTGITLSDYDPDNETFLLLCKGDTLLLNVPLEENRAPIFEAEYNAGRVSLINPVFTVLGDEILLKNLTFSCDSIGESYVYDRDRMLKFNKRNIIFEDEIDIVEDLDDILANLTGVDTTGTITPIYTSVTTKTSLIDVDIPVIPDSVRVKNRENNENILVMIITNQMYKNMPSVRYAESDGRSFRNYCEKILGVPGKNIIERRNMTHTDMKLRLDEFIYKAERMGKNSRVILYYAGHGVPDHVSELPYLVPVDYAISANMEEYAISLNSIYEKLGALKNDRVEVYLDCCFSGQTRDAVNIVEDRGIVMDVTQGEPQGNVFVLSACQGEQVAYAHKDQNHGLFTYFLLEKLKETKGEITMGELYDYVRNEVNSYSKLVIHNVQTPSFMTSETMSGKWRSLGFRNINPIIVTDGKKK